MQRITEVTSGTYLLEIKALSPFKIKAKMFTGQTFPKGYYYYSGSAQKNFYKRVERHVRKAKNVYWHIDHITSLKSNEIQTVFIFGKMKKNFECKIVEVLENKFGLKHIAKNFGNGDCSNCYSHLLYSKTKIDHSHFISLYQSTVRFIPSSKEIF